MARIRLKLGENEVEIDSRDFYVDNDTSLQVISDLARTLGENSARVIEADEHSFAAPQDIATVYQTNLDYLKNLRDAEFHEPEFTAATPVTEDELPSKIELLDRDLFFAKPRTVLETVEQLRDYGFVASPLDVSKALARLAFHKSLAKNLQENKTYYFKEQLVS